MLAHLQNNPDGIDLVEIAVSDFNVQSCIDEAHMKTVDVSLPVVMAEISPDHYNLIDGNHRMEKARRSGVSKVWAYKFTMPQHISFLTSTKAYLSYVEYWNGKVKQIRRQEELNKQIPRAVRHPRELRRGDAVNRVRRDEQRGEAVMRWNGGGEHFRQ